MGGGPRGTAETTAGALAQPVAAEAPAPRKHKLKDTWWRHVVGIVGIVVALFPVVFVLSSSFNRDNTLSGTTIVPTHVTLHNFGNLLHNNVKQVSGGTFDAPYVNWILNSMIVAGGTAPFPTKAGARPPAAPPPVRSHRRRARGAARLPLPL